MLSFGERPFHFAPYLMRCCLDRRRRQQKKVSRQHSLRRRRIFVFALHACLAFPIFGRPGPKLFIIPFPMFVSYHSGWKILLSNKERLNECIVQKERNTGSSCPHYRRSLTSSASCLITPPSMLLSSSFHQFPSTVQNIFLVSFSHMTSEGSTSKTGIA